MTDLWRLLARAVALGASDLHLTCGLPPQVRVHGRLAPLLDEAPPPAPGGVEALFGEVLTPRQRAALEVERSVDLALVLDRARGGEGQRFRVNLFASAGQVAAAVRRLDDRLRGFDELRLPPQLARLADLEDGLVLLVGPTGSGKTTTLAAIIDKINREEACHVVTLEDPIEYVHESRRALVHQRELHADFDRFSRALRAALREDPDVILVGEMRDVATMRAALMAAETGHLVLSTLHSGSAIGATERLIGAFRGDERDSIRYQLSLVLRCVVAQRLLPLAEGGGRFPATEVLWITPAVANLIRAGKTAQIQAAVEGQAAQGMLTLEQSLAEAVQRGWVTEAAAQAAARDPGAFAERLRHARGGAFTRLSAR